MSLRTNGARAACLLIALSSCSKKSAPEATSASKDIKLDAGASDAGADVRDAGPAIPTIPTVACDTSPAIGWSVDPLRAFSCSPMRTSELSPGAPSAYLDESGATVTPLDVTMAPGAWFAFSVAVRDDKGAAVPTSKIRYEVKGVAPAKVNVGARELQWVVAGANGDTLLFSVAAHVTLPTGARCVRQPVVVHVRDDDATRANQVAASVRWEQLSRKVSCMWAHQGPDLAANGQADMQDETDARKAIACGANLVTVRMKDLDGDGLADAIVRFDGRPRLDAKSGEPALETGFSAQLHFRKGNSFARGLEAPGDLYEAADGSKLFLDIGEIDRMQCPPRPYMSTGAATNCPLGSVDVFRVIGGKLEKTNTVFGEAIPGHDPSSMTCPNVPLEIVKDAKGRVTGFRKGKTTIPWDAKAEP